MKANHARPRVAPSPIRRLAGIVGILCAACSDGVTTPANDLGIEVSGAVKPGQSFLVLIRDGGATGANPTADLGGTNLKLIVESDSTLAGIVPEVAAGVKTLHVEIGDRSGEVEVTVQAAEVIANPTARVTTLLDESLALAERGPPPGVEAAEWSRELATQDSLIDVAKAKFATETPAAKLEIARMLTDLARYRELEMEAAAPSGLRGALVPTRPQMDVGVPYDDYCMNQYVHNSKNGGKRFIDVWGTPKEMSPIEAASYAIKEFVRWTQTSSTPNMVTYQKALNGERPLRKFINPRGLEYTCWGIFELEKNPYPIRASPWSTSLAGLVIRGIRAPASLPSPNATGDAALVFEHRTTIPLYLTALFRPMDSSAAALYPDIASFNEILRWVSQRAEESPLVRELIGDDSWAPLPTTPQPPELFGIRTSWVVAENATLPEGVTVHVSPTQEPGKVNVFVLGRPIVDSPIRFDLVVKNFQDHRALVEGTVRGIAGKYDLISANGIPMPWDQGEGFVFLTFTLTMAADGKCAIGGRGRNQANGQELDWALESCTYTRDGMDDLTVRTIDDGDPNSLHIKYEDDGTIRGAVSNDRLIFRRQ